METNIFPEAPIINQHYQLDKYPEVGWIYVAIPEIKQDRHAIFSWVKVKGTIDGYEVNNFHLMPLPDGTLYFPVKAEICKRIGKNVGDKVHVILYADQTPADIPDELLFTLEDNPIAYQAFQSLTESLQQGIIDWIYSAANEEIKAERIIKTV
jgi:hypothetical protein